MSIRYLASACKMGQETAFGTIEFTTKLGHYGLKTDRHKLDANVLVSAVVVAMAGWICLRKVRAAGRSAIGAAGIPSIGRLLTRHAT
jgi:hypothetical protein